ncbi:hypothetical protein FOA43_003007 [Brettanomyces nanus]|uniref:Uncharacterized protein n=1 Tax=Eeniella nana TaxID=13502 RepID=A0A875RPZ2_EENNA|nr:uncharacterized protein FOA43_003007 [Brettanomyces nanus]QPG75650.1 hypothetical protein FOA43_003007 [Brettanomyces nanus]
MRYNYRSTLQLIKPFFSRRYAFPVNNRFIQSKADQQNEILAKYKVKLEAKAKQEGLKNVEQLREKMRDKIENKKKQFSKVDPLRELENLERAEKLKAAIEGKKGSKQDLGAMNPESSSKPFKTLDSFVKVENLKKLPANQISLIWRARFQMKDRSLCAAVPADSFGRMYEHARKNPRFVLPLPRDDAQVEKGEQDEAHVPVEMHFVQWSFVGPNTAHVMITSLTEYKLHNEYARPHTTVAFHSELKDSKHLVLMNGQVDKDAAVSLQDARLLLMNLQRFYGGLGEESEISKERLNMVKLFNRGSGEFDVKRFIELAEMIEN